MILEILALTGKNGIQASPFRATFATVKRVASPRNQYRNSFRPKLLDDRKPLRDALYRERTSKTQVFKKTLHTAVGHIAVNFGEGKVVGLPLIQESSRLQAEELSTTIRKHLYNPVSPFIVFPYVRSINHP